MSKQLCVIDGNCQADALNILLRNTPSFTRHFTIQRVVNYQKKHVPEEILSGCSLYIYQFLGEKWGEYSTERQLQLLPQGATSLCMPNMYFAGYWPFWRHIPGIIEFGDSLLEDLLARGLEKAQILKLYLKCPPALAGDPWQPIKPMLEQERKKEEHTPIKYVRLIEDNWLERQVFLTINHPAEFLLLHTANEILNLLGLGRLPASVEKTFTHPHGEFYLPIHPVHGQMLGMPFVWKERKYPCFAHSLTHEEYTIYYLAMRENGIKSVASALSLAPDNLAVHG